MVGFRSSLEIVDTGFRALPSFLRAGDAIVINTSATLPAAISATTDSGEQVVVHFSSRMADGSWTMEVRRPDGLGSQPYLGFAGGLLRLEGGGSISTAGRHPQARRLWIATVDVSGDLLAYLDRFGRPIR
jgi:S-adenosylmethionine:tRNA ribosyltransferase-isomerase